MIAKVPFECPGCRHEGLARLDLLGLPARCKRCGCQFRMPRHLRVPCRNCGDLLRVPPEVVDHGVTCRYCQRPFRVRLAEALPFRLDPSSFLLSPLLTPVSSPESPLLPAETPDLAAEVDTLRDALDSARDEIERLLARLEAMAAAERELRAELQIARERLDDPESHYTNQSSVPIEQPLAEVSRLSAVTTVRDFLPESPGRPADAEAFLGDEIQLLVQHLTAFDSSLLDPSRLAGTASVPPLPPAPLRDRRHVLDLGSTRLTNSSSSLEQDR